MKSKKLFAILTLVAFMMTLVPMAAFAAPTASRSASSYSMDVTSVAANNSDYATVTVYAADATNIPISNQGIIVVTDRDTDAVALHVDYAAWQTGLDGKFKATIKSAVKGTAKVAVALVDPAYAGGVPTQTTDIKNYLNGSTAVLASALQIVGSVSNLEFTSAAINTITMGADSVTAANGVTTKTVVATVSASGGSPVVGAEVTFSSNKTGLSFDKTSYITDNFGNATAKVTATASGTYAITATTGSKDATANYVFDALTDGYAIDIFAGDKQLVAKDSASSKMKVTVKDINGNKLTNVAATFWATTAVTWEVKTKPTGSTVTDAAVSGTETWDATDKIVYATFTPDKEGTYEIRAKLPNGKNVVFTQEAKTQGTITSATLAYDQVYLPIGSVPAAATAAPTIKYVDAAGVKSTAGAGSFTWSTSDPTVATVNAAGIVTVVATDSKYAKDITVTAIETAKKLVATAKISIGAQPASITLTADKTQVAINDKATVTIQLMDANGKPVAFPTSVVAPTITLIATKKPSIAALDTTTAASFASDLVKTGSTTFTVKSIVAGQTEVQCIVSDGTNNYVSSIAIEFKDAVAAVGAKSIVMFVGSTGFSKDGAPAAALVAPFIQDNRTYVGVRDVAKAFGVADADIAYANGVVTLKRSDVTVTITIGSKEIKTSNGKTIAMDVAAYITADGRTVLPIRFIGDAFGYTAAYDAATKSVTFNQ